MKQVYIVLNGRIGKSVIVLQKLIAVAVQINAIPIERLGILTPDWWMFDGYDLSGYREDTIGFISRAGDKDIYIYFNEKDAIAKIESDKGDKA